MTSPSKLNDSRAIGVTGGSSLVEIGSKSHVLDFFRFLGECEQNNSKCNWGLLTDRLFRRYVRQEHLAETVDLLESARNVDFDGRFAKVFDAIRYCAESAVLNFEGFKSYPGYQYEPVRFVISDQPWFLIEKKRPLLEYDELEEEPFWMR